MPYPSDGSKSTSSRDRAAVFVDYDDVYQYLSSDSANQTNLGEVLSELLRAVQQHLTRYFRASPKFMAAYADFSAFPRGSQDIEGNLYLQGVEPRFVPGAMQSNAAELQLCVDAVDCFNMHPDVRILVVISGGRPYVPLIQHALRNGRTPIVILFSPPGGDMPAVDRKVMLLASDLLRESTVRGLGIDPPAPTMAMASPPEPTAPRKPRKANYRQITHRGALAALDIIDEHFGQYDEIYLTPLLRKLSELLGDTESDPKSLISVLEDCGAAWLEKRKGYPYDFTVLLLDPDHPNVAASQQPRTYQAAGEESMMDYGTEPGYESQVYSPPYPGEGPASYPQRYYSMPQDAEEDMNEDRFPAGSPHKTPPHRASDP